MGEVSPKHKAEESPRLLLRLIEGKAKLGTHCINDRYSNEGWKEDKKETF